MTSQDGSRAVGRIAWLDVVAMTDGGEVVAKEDRNSERDQHNGNRICDNRRPAQPGSSQRTMLKSSGTRIRAAARDTSNSTTMDA
jgi:hypothetical protein